MYPPLIIFWREKLLFFKQSSALLTWILSWNLWWSNKQKYCYKYRSSLFDLLKLFQWTLLLVHRGGTKISIGLDKQKFLAYALGAQKNRLIETVLLSTNNICFGWEIRKLFFWYALLTKGLISQFVLTAEI